MNALTYTWRHVHVTGSESPLAYNARARESSRASLLFREDRFSTNFPSLRTFPKKKKEQTIKLIRRPILNLIVDSIAFLFHKLRLWKFVENTKMKQGFVKMENFDRIFFFLIRNRKIQSNCQKTFKINLVKRANRYFFFSFLEMKISTANTKNSRVNTTWRRMDSRNTNELRRKIQRRDDASRRKLSQDRWCHLRCCLVQQRWKFTRPHWVPRDSKSNRRFRIGSLSTFPTRRLFANLLLLTPLLIHADFREPGHELFIESIGHRYGSYPPFSRFFDLRRHLRFLDPREWKQKLFKILLIW